MKKVLCFVLALTMVVSLAACGLTEGDSGQTTKAASDNSQTQTQASVDSGNNQETQPASSGAPEGSVIRLAINIDPGNLGPWAANNTGRKQTLYEIYQSIIEIVPGGEAHSIMAKDYYMIDDYKFHLEIFDNITDSDGNRITADDIKFCYTNEDFIAKSQISKYIEDVEIIDDYNLEFTLNTTMTDGMERILYNWVVSEKAYTESGDGMASRPVGTGPYVMTDYVEGSYMKMEARKDYWKTENLDQIEEANVETLEFYVVQEAAQQVVSLETDAVDVVMNMDSTQVSRFQDNADFKVFADTSNTTYSLFLNCDPSASTSDIAVRQAILYAIDVDGIISGALDGAGVKAFTYGSPLFSDILDSWDDGNYYEYDPDKAKELLEDAGYKDGDVTVRFLLRSLELDQRIGQIIQGYLEKVGIICELNPYEETLAKTYVKDHSTWDLYMRNAGQDFKMVHGWNNDFSEKNWDTGIGYNGIHDEKLEELLQICQNLPTYTDEKMTELHEYIKDQAIVYGMFQPIVYTVTKAGTFESLIFNASFWLWPGACKFAWN